MASAPDLPRIVVLGGGFAGLSAIDRLRHLAVDVTLVDRNDHHTFRPLLYQVALRGLDIAGVAPGLDGLVPAGTRLVRDEVVGLDLDAQVVHLAGGSDLDYDWLVVALGATVDHFGVAGAADHSVPFTEMRDASRLRSSLDALDEGARVVVIGGGPTGVEVAGALADRVARGEIDVRIELVELGDELLPRYRGASSRHGLDALTDRDVDVRLGDAVTEVGRRFVRLGSGAVRPADLVVWASGISARPVADALGLPVADSGRVPVDDTLRLRGDVFVVGDLAGVAGERPAPQLAAVAQQQGAHAGDEISRALGDRPRRPFRYTDKGTLAVVADGAAVADLPGGLTLTGLPAWVLWYGVHLAVLPGIDAKVAVTRDWVVEGSRRVPLVGGALADGLAAVLPLPAPSCPSREEPTERLPRAS